MFALPRHRFRGDAPNRLPAVQRFVLRALRFAASARNRRARCHRTRSRAFSLVRHVALSFGAPRCAPRHSRRGLDAHAAQPPPSRRFLKEEGANPTGSFKARGLALAVTMARHYGLRQLAVPSAGNAAGALAAYAAAAEIAAHIFMPRDVPFANYVEAIAYGAHVTLVDGLISDCGRIVAELSKSEGWFDISTLKEPFRVEGKKTMGYELVEQLGWEYPDAVFYPTGGGVGLIGMWKAFAELEELGWVKPGKRPRMIAVQSSGCAPVAKAFDEGASASEMWPNAATFASGLRVPKPYGDSIMLEILRESGGTAVAIPDAEILASLRDWAKHEGLFLSPEGAAATAAYDRLLSSGFLTPRDRVVLFNTGAGLKYTDVIAEAMNLPRPAPGG